MFSKTGLPEVLVGIPALWLFEVLIGPINQMMLYLPYMAADSPELVMSTVSCLLLVISMGFFGLLCILLVVEHYGILLGAALRDYYETNISGWL